MDTYILDYIDRNIGFFEDNEDELVSLLMDKFDLTEDEANDILDTYELLDADFEDSRVIYTGELEEEEEGFDSL